MFFSTPIATSLSASIFNAFSITLFLMPASLIVFCIIISAIGSKENFFVKIYSLTFLLIFFSSFLTAIIASTLNKPQVSIEAFTICVVSMGVFIASGIFQSNQEKKIIKKFKSSPRYKATIIGLKSIDSLHRKYNGPINERILTIILNYYDSNGESKICTSYYKYNEYEVTYLLNLNTPIEVYVYKNQCSIATPIEPFTGDVNKNEINALLTKKFNDDIFKH